MNSLIGRELGHYRIIEQLGEGGMAIVYKAFDTHLERDVAVKVIRTDQFAPAALEQILKRFEREAKLLAKLSHPNIVGVIDYGSFKKVPYLVMEYFPGGTIKDRLGKPIQAPEAAKLLLPIARALDYAHRQGMVHRDVKPSNILITADGEPMLTDFGIAKLLEGDGGQTLTAAGVGIGTPEYMAPEQWIGKAAPASDQYSLGIIYYEMITGKKPYEAETPAAILLKQMNDPLTSPGKIIPGLDPKVEKFLFKSLARNAENRFSSMADAFEELSMLSTLSPSTIQKGNKPAVEYQPSQMDTKKTFLEISTPADQQTPPLVPNGQPKHQSKRMVVKQFSAMKKYWWIGSIVLVLAAVLVSGTYGIGPLEFLERSIIVHVKISNQSCEQKRIYIDNEYYSSLAPDSERTFILEGRKHNYMACSLGDLDCEGRETMNPEIVIPRRAGCY